MTRDELAALLNGREYGSEITKGEEAQAKAAGLVVVFGYSDDGVELRGAISEDIAAYDGTTFRVSRDGHVLIDWEDLDKDDEAEVEAYFERKRQSATIDAIWSPTEPACSWAYATDLPHTTFDVMEDGELYCRGIVFALADLEVIPSPAGFDLVRHLRRQIEFSVRTFGPGDRTAGVCDHIRKELCEVQDDAAAGRPTLGEWVDVTILALDGAWRSGATPEQITSAIEAKQAKNEARRWPDWRTQDPGKAIEHDRTADAAA